MVLHDKPSSPVAVHTGFPPRKQDKWSDWTTMEEQRQQEPLLLRIENMKKARLTGGVVVRNFVSRRIQPLQQLVNFGFEYLGANDPSRISSTKLPTKEVFRRVTRVLVKLEHR